MVGEQQAPNLFEGLKNTMGNRMATEFLAARADKDKAKQKQLKKQLGTTLT